MGAGAYRVRKDFGMGRDHHALNLITSTSLAVGNLQLFPWECAPMARVLSVIVLATSILYHGAHCMGYDRLANTRFMFLDMMAVATGIVSLLAISPAKHVTLPGVATCGVLFALTWGRLPLSGLPFNPTLSVLHAAGYLITSHVAAFNCGTGLFA